MNHPPLEAHLRYLDALRAEYPKLDLSLAAPLLVRHFGLSKPEARGTLHYWIETYPQRAASQPSRRRP